MSSQTSKAESIRQGVPRMPSHSSAASRDDTDAPPSPKRAGTLQNGTANASKSAAGDDHKGPDAFETGNHSDHEEDHEEHTRTSVEMDELPIELITLTDSFIESLSQKVHSKPPNMERLSRLFQDFYTLASSHINTHISALATKQSRDTSPTPSATSISSAASRLRSKAASLGSKDRPKPAESAPEQQMITADELANRKRARKALVAKKGLLEEAVERRLCEGIYDRIYRHRSTQDEAQDGKLRSKTAALALVGISPVDLGVDYGEAASQSPEAMAKVTEKMRTSLGEARTDLARMGESRYPLAKANHLKAAHKSIVDTLAEFHPSASADEIMPMLIYALITMPPEKLNVISDLHFIQYFRWEPKLTGEAAYCLTNLEAAISFLETVDLSTLRADELPSGPPKSEDQAGTPKPETFPPAYTQGAITPSIQTTEANTDNATAAKPAPSPGGLKATNVLRNRGLSDLVNTPAQAFGAASDAVFSTADHGLKTISNSLGDSYSFLLGKLRERQQGPKESIVVPRTLDDARKLVSTPPPEEDDGASIDEVAEEQQLQQSKRPSGRDERVLSLIGGRRDHSADSARSGQSASSASKKVLFAEESKPSATSTTQATITGAAAQAPAAMLDQVRSLGSTFNPIGRLSSIGMIRGFGRTPSASNTPPIKDPNQPADGGDLASAFPDIAAALPPKTISPQQPLVPKIAPPNRRFLDLQSPGELKLGEVRELLKEYKRLAVALQKMGAFEEEKG